MEPFRGLLAQYFDPASAAGEQPELVDMTIAIVDDEPDYIKLILEEASKEVGFSTGMRVSRAAQLVEAITERSSGLNTGPKEDLVKFLSEKSRQGGGSSGPILSSVFNLVDRNILDLTMAEELATEVLGNVRVPFQPLKHRLAAYGLVDTLTRRFRSAVTDEKARQDYIRKAARWFLRISEGEKDPRALVEVFRIFGSLGRGFCAEDHGDWSGLDNTREDWFENLIMYFPISYVPPPNPEDIVVTRESLDMSYRDAFAGSVFICSNLIEFLLENISSGESKETQADAAEFLASMIPELSVSVVGSQVKDIWWTVIQEIVHASDPGIAAGCEKVLHNTLVLLNSVKDIVGDGSSSPEAVMANEQSYHPELGEKPDFDKREFMYLSSLGELAKLVADYCRREMDFDSNDPKFRQACAGVVSDAIGTGVFSAVYLLRRFGHLAYNRLEYAPHPHSQKASSPVAQTTSPFWMELFTNMCLAAKVYKDNADVQMALEAYASQVVNQLYNIVEEALGVIHDSTGQTLQTALKALGAICEVTGDVCVQPKFSELLELLIAGLTCHRRRDDNEVQEAIGTFFVTVSVNSLRARDEIAPIVKRLLGETRQMNDDPELRDLLLQAVVSLSAGGRVLQATFDELLRAVCMEGSEPIAAQAAALKKLTGGIVTDVTYESAEMLKSLEGLVNRPIGSSVVDPLALQNTVDAVRGWMRLCKHVDPSGLIKVCEEQLADLLENSESVLVPLAVIACFADAESDCAFADVKLVSRVADAALVESTLASQLASDVFGSLLSWSISHNADSLTQILMGKVSSVKSIVVDFEYDEPARRNALDFILTAVRALVAVGNGRVNATISSLVTMLKSLEPEDLRSYLAKHFGEVFSKVGESGANVAFSPIQIGFRRNLVSSVIGQLSGILRTEAHAPRHAVVLALAGVISRCPSHLLLESLPRAQLAKTFVVVTSELRSMTHNRLVVIDALFVMTKLAPEVASAGLSSVLEAVFEPRGETKDTMQVRVRLMEYMAFLSGKAIDSKRRLAVRDEVVRKLRPFLDDPKRRVRAACVEAKNRWHQL